MSTTQWSEALHNDGELAREGRPLKSRDFTTHVTFSVWLHALFSLGIGRLDGPFIFQKSSTYNQRSYCMLFDLHGSSIALRYRFPVWPAVYFPFADFLGPRAALLCDIAPNQLLLAARS
jgi:hypothetical protein